MTHPEVATLKMNKDKNEVQRLQALYALRILDTPAEERFNRISRLATQLLQVPIALIGFTDAERQWFKSCEGLAISEIDRADSFSEYALFSNETYIIPDTLRDERFATSPLVVNEPKIRFYAGHPLKTSDGDRVGTLCCIDHQPRELSENDLQIIQDLVDIIERELNLTEQNDLQARLIEANQSFQRLLDQTEEQAQRLSNFNEMMTALSQAQSAKEAFSITAQQINKVIDVGRISVALVSWEDNQAEIFVMDGVDGAIPTGTKIPLSGSNVGDAVTQQVVKVIPDLAQNQKLEAAQLTKQGLRSAMIVPLITGGQAIGALNVGSQSIDAFGEKEEQFVLQIASFLASAVENQRLVDDLQQSVSLLEATLEATADGILVVDQTGKIVSFNQKFVEMWQMPDEVLKDRVEEQASTFILSQLTEPEQYLAKMKQLQSQPRATSFDVLHFKDGRIFERHSQPQMTGAQIIGRVWSFRDVTNSKFIEERLTKRAAELEVVTQVGTIAAAATDSQELLQTVVEKTRRSFGLYQVQIYLLDEATQSLRLAAGTGDAGAEMIAQNWQVSLNDEDAVIVQAIRLKQGLIVDDVRELPAYPSHPMLPDTRSELTTPLMIGDRATGVLNLLSEQVGQFTREDVLIQTLLASQIAVALENTRLLEQSQRQARREAMVNQISQKIQATSTVESALQAAIQEIGKVFQAQHTTVELKPVHHVDFQDVLEKKERL